MTPPARLAVVIALGLGLAAGSAALPAAAVSAQATTPTAATTTAAAATTAPTAATTTPAAARATAPAATGTSGTTTVTQTGTVLVRTQASSRNSSAAIAIIAVVCLLALGLLAWEAARWWAYEPAWALRLRHAFAEAGLRCAETWSELLDWARGR